MRPRRVLAGAGATALMGFSAIVADAFYSLDPTFGGGDGIVRTDGPGASADDIDALAVQPDGKVLAAGFMTTPDARDFAVARYNPNGTLDSTFGEGDGIATTNIGPQSRDLAFGIALQADGKVILAGITIPNAPGASQDTAVVRYDADGTLDESFDGDSGTGNGIVVIPASSEDDYAADVAVDSEGRIVLAGGLIETIDPYVEDLAVMRLATDGTLDDAFGGDGIVTTDFTGVNGSDGALAVGVADDDDVIAGGFGDPDGGDGGWALARYNAVDGSLDEDFDGDSEDGDGAFLIPNNGSVSDLVVHTGKIAVAGGPGFTLGRLNLVDGTTDPSFGGDGFASASFGLGFSASVNSIAIDGQRYVAAGSATENATSDQSFAFARFFGGGEMDDQFGPNGTLIRNIARRTATVQGFEEVGGVGVIDDGNALTPNKVVGGGGVWYGESVANEDFTVVQVAEDTTAPTTTITRPAPGRTTKRRPRLRFTANEPATFRCRVDGRAWVAGCQSEQSFGRLSLGRHRFRVEATDESGNVETPPAKRTIRIVRK